MPQHNNCMANILQTLFSHPYFTEENIKGHKVIRYAQSHSASECE